MRLRGPALAWPRRMAWGARSFGLGLALVIPALFVAWGGNSGCAGPCSGGCGTCALSVEDYCARDPGKTWDQESCTFSGSFECYPEGLPSRLVHTGCGYIRTSWEGDEGDHGESVFDESTWELVYKLYNGGLGAQACIHETVAGTKPECEQWTETCSAYLKDSGGPEMGGAGGAGGAGP